MSQQQPKKPASATQASAKFASGAANKVTQTAFSAAESTRKSAQNVVNIGTNAVRDLLSSSTGEVAKAQQKAFDMSRESVENLTRGADMATKLVVECATIARDNMDACIECSTVASSVAQDITTEISECCNRAFSDAVELSKDAFNCRTLNDILEWQSRAFRQTMDTAFSESNKLSNILFQSCTDALEPINERIAEASDQISKVLAA